MIELDPGSVKEKRDAYTSLTDLYGVEVFTDRFMRSVEKENKQKEQIDANIIGNIFTDSFKEESLEDSGIKEFLFQENTSQILIKNYNEAEQHISAFQACMVAISMLGVLIIYRFFWQEKRGGKAKDGIKINTSFSK